MFYIKNKNMVMNMKKYIFYIVCTLGLSIVVFGSVFIVKQKQQKDFGLYVMEELGGEGSLKKKCVDSNLEHVRLLDGKTLTRQFTGNDLTRVDRMCDCVVAKSFKQIIRDKTKWQEIVSQYLPDDIKGSLQDMFLINYQACEIELEIWLKKHYKPIKVK